MTLRKLHTAVVPDQSAVIPYRTRDGIIEVLLITTRGKSKWIVPKGTIKADQGSLESAGREAWEEAGVEGHISPVSLGCYRHGKSGSAPIVEVFLMRVDQELSSWPEQRERSRRWIPFEEAYEHVEEEGLRSILDEAAALMRLALGGRAPSDGLASHPAVPAHGGLTEEEVP